MLSINWSASDCWASSESYVKSGALVPVFPDRKAVRVHGHHIVYPEPHGKWSKVERFMAWLRREAARSAPVERLRQRVK
jgi:DNA-binding transcriptional LysR family regulator